ncbi:MAG TPA: hypothetical protein VIR27_20475 [Mycobacteriales bacterium]
MTAFPPRSARVDPTGAWVRTWRSASVRTGSAVGFVSAAWVLTRSVILTVLAAALAVWAWRATRATPVTTITRVTRASR